MWSSVGQMHMSTPARLCVPCPLSWWQTFGPEVHAEQLSNLTLEEFENAVMSDGNAGVNPVITGEELSFCCRQASRPWAVFNRTAPLRKERTPPMIRSVSRLVRTRVFAFEAKHPLLSRHTVWQDRNGPFYHSRESNAVVEATTACASTSNRWDGGLIFVSCSSRQV